MLWITWILIFMLTRYGQCANILMLTTGTTKSHTIPFLALANELLERDHTVTFISAFKSDISNLEEIHPPDFVEYIKNYTNWDIAGARMKGEEPQSITDILRFSSEACESFYGDSVIKAFLRSGRKFDVLILDSIFPELSMGIVHIMKMPFIYLNTIPFYILEFSMVGNPAPYSVTPFAAKSFTDDMNFVQRLQNTFWSIVAQTLHTISLNRARKVLRKHFPDMPESNEMIKNVSIMLQNGHYTVNYPRPYLPNIIEMGCIQCRPPKPLDKKLEDFINLGGDKGFIFISMGSSVKTDNTPKELRLMLIKTLARLPYQILWKWDTEDVKDLPKNVMIQKWLPQQDLIGHKKIRVFVTHSGIMSTVESVYHGVPVVTTPVFCDQDSNAMKAVVDGYGLKVEFNGLTSDMLYDAIMRVATEPSFRKNAKLRQKLMKDDINTPMQKSVFWVEYVIRHKGASVFLTPARNYNLFQYYSVDTLAFMFVSVLILLWFIKKMFSISIVCIFSQKKHKYD